MDGLRPRLLTSEQSSAEFADFSRSSETLADDNECTCWVWGCFGASLKPLLATYR